MLLVNLEFNANHLEFSYAFDFYNLTSWSQLILILNSARYHCEIRLTIY